MSDVAFAEFTKILLDLQYEMKLEFIVENKN